MIKANELRMFNYVQPKGKPIMQVVELNCLGSIGCLIEPVMYFGNEPFYFDEDDLNHIPLSEDILLRLGFVRINHSWSLNDGSENYHYEINGNERHFLLYFNGRQFSANDGKLSSFRYENNKYLHQLQNLYFALTGTELTLNP